MKIPGSGSAPRSDSTRKTARAGARGGNFAAHLTSEEKSSDVTGLTGTVPLTRMPSLLGVPEIDDPATKRRQLLKRGSNLLRELDAIRLALLEGRIDHARILQISQLLREDRPAITDPALLEVLSEIELRVAVELAKLGR